MPSIAQSIGLQGLSRAADDSVAKSASLSLAIACVERFRSLLPSGLCANRLASGRGQSSNSYDWRVLPPRLPERLAYDAGVSDQDAARLRRWAEGDAEAGRQLVHDNFALVRRFFVTKVPDTDAEDLIQNTFQACLESASRFRGESPFRSFLMGIARNMLLRFFDARRKAARFDPLTHSVQDGGESPSAAVAGDESRAMLLRGLRRLPLDQQIALELYYWEEYSVAELAEVLGVSVTAAKSRVFRARQSLKTTLEEIEKEPAKVSDTLGTFGRWREELPQT